MMKFRLYFLGVFLTITAFGFVSHSATIPPQSPLKEVFVASYALVSLIVLEIFLAVVGTLKGSEVYGSSFASSVMAAMAYSLTFGLLLPDINIWYDDWGVAVRYFGAPLVTPFFKEVLNDHYAPALSLYLNLLGTVSPLHYFPLAISQLLAFIVLLRLLALISERIGAPSILTAAALAAFAAWPTQGMARLWFSGGFWLTASTAVLFLLLLHSQKIMECGCLKRADAMYFILLTILSIFGSSQTMIPAIYLCPFVLALASVNVGDPVAKRAFFALTGITLLGSAVMLILRGVLIERAPMDYTGLIRGNLFQNIATFIRTMIFDQDKWYENLLYPAWIWIVILPIIGIPALLVHKSLAPFISRFRTIFEPDKMQGAVRLHPAFAWVLVGVLTVVVPIAQIGIARRWDRSAVLNEYYVTLPMVGCWIIFVVALALLYRSVLNFIPSTLRLYGQALAAAVAVGLSLLCVVSTGMTLRSRPSVAAFLSTTKDTGRFVAHLGVALCQQIDIAKSGITTPSRQQIRFTDCHKCKSVFGPAGFLQSLDDQVFMRRLAKATTRAYCPQSDVKLLFDANALNADIYYTANGPLDQFLQREMR
jgi:hypothetical protein